PPCVPTGKKVPPARNVRRNTTLNPKRLRNKYLVGRDGRHPYDLAPVHSITSSARVSGGSGTVRPSALAVLRAESPTPGPGERFRSLHWSCGDNGCPPES